MEKEKKKKKTAAFSLKIVEIPAVCIFSLCCSILSSTYEAISIQFCQIYVLYSLAIEQLYILLNTPWILSTWSDLIISTY